MNLDESALDSGTFIYLNVAQKMFCSIDVGLPFVLLKFLTFSSFSVSLSLYQTFLLRFRFCFLKRKQTSLRPQKYKNENNNSNSKKDNNNSNNNFSNNNNDDNNNNNEKRSVLNEMDNADNIIKFRADAMAQSIRLHLQSCGPGFESQVHLHFLQFIWLKWILCMRFECEKNEK